MPAPLRVHGREESCVLQTLDSAHKRRTDYETIQKTNTYDQLLSMSKSPGTQNLALVGDPQDSL